MPSFFYAMDQGTVTLVPKEESFVIASDKRISDSLSLKQLAMDQGSGQLLAAAFKNDINNDFVYAINPHKKTWQLIHRTDNTDRYNACEIDVCDDSIFILDCDKIIRWNATTKMGSVIWTDRLSISNSLSLAKDGHGRRIAVVGGNVIGRTVLMDVDTQHIIDQVFANGWSRRVAITHLSNGSTLFASTGLQGEIVVKAASDEKPSLVIRRARRDGYCNIFLYEDIHKRPTLVRYDQEEGYIDIYDACTGVLCDNKKMQLGSRLPGLRHGGQFEFRQKDGRAFVAMSQRGASKIELFDISDRDAWKLVSTCVVNDAHGYKKSFGMSIDDFGYPHLAEITQEWGSHSCWPLELWEPKERAHTLAQIKSALQTHLVPEGIAHTILGYAGSAEHAHAIDRYNEPQESSGSQEAELPIAPIGTEGLTEGRLQVYEGPPPAHPSWFVRNQKWLNWVALGCSLVPLVMLVATIIKNRRH